MAEKQFRYQQRRRGLKKKKGVAPRLKTRVSNQDRRREKGTKRECQLKALHRKKEGSKKNEEGRN